jgi:hypothetical protein
MKNTYYRVQGKSKEHELLKETHELYLLGNKYKVVHYDCDKYDLYLSKEKGGGVITLCQNAKNKCFIIGLYSEYNKTHTFDSTDVPQNLDLVIKAVDSTRKYIDEKSI